MTDDVLISIDGPTGRLSLNRPKAIHALNTGMCRAMLAALVDWRSDPAVRLVMIDHAAGRGFCAGGDIRALWESGGGDGAIARDFFRIEYQLNHLLFTYAKPVMAFMDGITMGGGVGISQPAKYRIATERTVYAMPETGIGLFPDVGAGWYLSRLPGRTGPWLAVTGARIDGADCLALGLATHYVPSGALSQLKADLVARPGDIEGVLAAASATPPESKIAGWRADIDRLFASDRYEDILAALEADGGEWAAAQRATLATKSPQACKVSLRELAESLRLTDFADEMRMEYGIGTKVVQRHDFLEGVRALIVDKDNQPRWEPATPEAVTDHLIDTIFAPLDPAEAWEPYRG
ncbi:enoyl-CoA hydratase/isomerase family protein [Sphingomonas naphthae]|uniref:3-hydroxyisobutyryl-CoA hydrolase n=1 Tax=Sphingomonas naphthae TaxID=1813468 RepID=A0ABY7TIY2_9SPHN|nr:enoyl-CoA hydratase/isomerase family protein [Sphingomonas naphthae]WCT72848.1 enoyl-CoA hydratase/isomerase family protein [Sphingomonas naphthae]